MNKNISRVKKTVRIFGIKICESEEQYENVNLENVEPITPFIVTEYEIENFKNNRND